MSRRFRARFSAPFLPLACLLPSTAGAQDAPPEAGTGSKPATPAPELLVVAERKNQAIEKAPSTTASIDAGQIATTVNAVNVEDTLKYLPSLIVRKRHVGDTQAPLATRTSGLGASARSLVYADGALLSALIGNNNSSASPRWSLVSPQEIARIDVLYGPFSPAYPGNSIGAVVNITTRLPDRLEATATVGTIVQTFSQYGTDGTLPATQLGATAGDRFGPLALFASVDHVASHGQPLLYATANRPPTAGGAGTPTLGGYPDLGRTGQPITVAGASGFEHQRQDQFKLKAALDLTSNLRLTYVGGLFLNDTDAHAQTYLRDGETGAPVYSGALNIGGYPVALAAGAFSNGVYAYNERHWSHALSATGAGGRFTWQVIGTDYDFAHDVQRVPSMSLPAAAAGGAGNITRLDGTGWQTLDAKGSWATDAAGTHTLSFGAHGDRFTLRSDRFSTADWRTGSEGALNLRSRGRTRTLALWAQDAWRLAAPLTLTVGGRYEGWRAYDGVNASLSPAVATDQPTERAARFSPKASLSWAAASRWTVRASFGEAWRFPTVGELYQLVTSPVPVLPDPDLRPERALSEELALERHDDRGTARLSVFNEVIADALISQSGPLPGTAQFGTYVQNVDRTRARGVEVAWDRHDVIARVDLSGSVTYADAETRRDAVLPAAQGKLLPQVPHWKATLVGTWRPIHGLALTAAGRYSSRQYGTIDNSDIVGNTYTGFYKYLVVDLRAEVKAGGHMTLGLGIDNANNDRYFLYHPFPQRTFHVDATVKL